MSTSAIFPGIPMRAGMYESFYLRAVDPREPVGVWIRNTVHKRPGLAPLGSVWCTIFDAGDGRPFMHKLTSAALSSPPDGWIAIGDAGSEGALFAPGQARGTCGGASWTLRWAAQTPELRHLPREWLYRAALPRTKLTSPAPAAVFDGSVELAGGRRLELEGWRGMVGHNWGSEHAERWIWLHGIGFRESPDAWLDVALGRIKLAGRLTPWVANGSVFLNGRRRRLGGLGARGLRVNEAPDECTLELPGEGGSRVRARVGVPAGAAAGWRYADPDGGEHDVVNCSVASLELSVSSPEDGGSPAELTTAHGAAYELGMRERDHGVPIAPFADGELL
jgi:hypothetical protein